jgi:OHCU decarboxylase
VTTKWLDELPRQQAFQQLLTCCGSKRWADAMVEKRPFGDAASVESIADSIWWALGREDWLEAFAAHPRIGSKKDVASKEGVAKAWAEGEQAGARSATDAVKDALAAANAEYEARFGHIYIVCATGKSAEEMLALCRARLAHGHDEELRVAAGQQMQITILRLRKLLAAPPEKTT